MENVTEILGGSQTVGQLSPVEYGEMQKVKRARKDIWCEMCQQFHRLNQFEVSAKKETEKQQ